MLYANPLLNDPASPAGPVQQRAHYAERAWAGLLSPPLPPAAEEALRSAAANVCREPAAARLHADEDTHCLIGQLVGCECGRKGDPGSSCKHTC